jgi:hypothetical protein
VNISTRPNRFLVGISSQLNQKLPSNLSADELNVVLGLGTATVAANTAFTLQATAPRDMFVRDLVVQAPADVVINAITINGDALVLGGAVTAPIFSSGNLNRPEFGLPVKGGTQVVVQGTNGATANAFIAATFAID